MLRRFRYVKIFLQTEKPTNQNKTHEILYKSVNINGARSAWARIRIETTFLDKTVTRLWLLANGLLNVESYSYGTLPSQVPIREMEHESTVEISSLLLTEISGS